MLHLLTSHSSCVYVSNIKNGQDQAKSPIPSTYTQINALHTDDLVEECSGSLHAYGSLMFIHPSIHTFIYIYCIYTYIHTSIHLFAYMCKYTYIYIFIYLFIYLLIYLFKYCLFSMVLTPGASRAPWHEQSWRPGPPRSCSMSRPSGLIPWWKLGWSPCFEYHHDSDGKTLLTTSLWVNMYVGFKKIRYFLVIWY